MSKLIRFKDTDAQRWSRVDLLSGDPIYISIAQSGVLIKKSNLGIMGTVLYKESVFDNITKLGIHLQSSINEFNTPKDMRNLPLKVFTQIALESNTIEEFCGRIKRAEKEAEI